MPRSSNGYFHLILSDQNCAFISHLLHASYTPRPHHPSWFDHTNNLMKSWVAITKFPTTFYVQIFSSALYPYCYTHLCAFLGLGINFHLTFIHCCNQRRVFPIIQINTYCRHFMAPWLIIVGRPCRSSAVRRWLPTTAARVRVRAACGVCGGHSGTGAGFLWVLRFPLPIIPPISPLS
jgi:hypothetical protein